MGKSVARVVVAVLLMLSILPAPRLQAAGAVAPFWDVLGTSYQDAVGRLFALKLVSGMSENQFSPDATVTRAQMAAFAVRALKASDMVPLGQQGFGDVPPEHWAHGMVLRAAELGIVRGAGGGLFYPENTVTQGETLAMLVRMLGYEGTVQGEWPVGHLLKGKEIGLLEGVSDFAFGIPASRGVVALLLDNAVFRVTRQGSDVTLSQAVHRQPVSLAIVPKGGGLATGLARLSAVGKDHVGRDLAVANVTWQLVSGDGQVNQDGQLFITGDAPVTVSASAGGLSAMETYTVAGSMRLRAARDFAKPGETVRLTAEGVTASGEVLPLQPEWQVESGPGQVTTAGVLTVSGPGPVVVRATAGQLRGTVTVTGVTGLQVTPSGTTVAAGETVRFTAAQPDAGGGALAVEWSVVSGGGSITKEGVFTAGTQNAVIQAKAGSAVTTVGVQVVARIEVSPASASVGKGGTQQFTAVAKSGDGVAVPVSVTWSAPSSLGIVDGQGRFVGTGSGAGVITATFRSVSGTASLSVGGTPTTVRVTADKTSVVANAKSQIQLTATVVDTNGNTVPNHTGNVMFTLDSAIRGSLNRTEAALSGGLATATFTPSLTAGTVRVFASLPGTVVGGGYLDITTTASTATKVELRAFPSTIAASTGSTTTISATLVDQDGQPLNNNTGTTIIVTLIQSGGGTLSNTQATIYYGQSAGNVTFTGDGLEGSATINGSSPYTVVPVTIQSVLAGSPHKLALTSLTPTLADGSATMTVKVAIQDQKGTTRTQDTGVLITLSARIGAVTPTGFPKQATTTGGVASFAVTTTQAGTWDFTATGGGLVPATASGEFQPGSPNKIDLAADPALGAGSLGYITADAGQSTVKLRARVLDANNNLVPWAGHLVTFSRTVNNSVTNYSGSNAINAIAGVAELTLTSTNSVGSDTYQAIASGLASSSPLIITSRVTGQAVKLRIQPLGDARVNDPITVKVWALDAADNAVTTARDTTVSLYSTSTTTDLGGPQPLVNGQATFVIKDTTAGAITITATAPGLAADTTGRAFNLAAAPADRVELSAVPDVIPSDGTSMALVSAKMVDAFGNTIVGGTTVTLTISGPATLTSSSVSTGSNMSLRATTAPGTIVITGSAANGLMVKPVTIISSTPGTPTKVVLEEVAPITAGTQPSSQLTLRVRIIDSNGNVAANLNSGTGVSYMGVTLSGMAANNTVTITATGSTGLSERGFTADGQTRGGAAVVNGVATFTHTNTKAETVTVTPLVYYNGQPLTAVPGTIRTLPGPVYQVILDPTAPVLPTHVASTRKLTAKLVDLNGNSVAQSGETIRFSLSHEVYLSLPSVSTIAAETGEASIDLTSRVHGTGGATTLTVTSGKTGKSATATVMTDQPPAKAGLFVTSTGGGSTLTSGYHLQVAINGDRRNAARNILVYVNGLQVPLHDVAGGSGTITTIPAGSTGITGYLNYSELGGVGSKSITVILTNDLGTSPVSDAAYVTVQ